MAHAAVTEPQADTRGAPDDNTGAVGAERRVVGDDLSRREPAPDGIVPDRSQARRGVGGSRGIPRVGSRALLATRVRASLWRTGLRPNRRPS